MIPFLDGAPADLLLLLPLAVAAGLDLFLALLILGAVASTSHGATLPGALGDLAWGPVMAMAGLFYVLETAAEQRLTSGLLWHAMQALARPLGAALLVLLLLDGQEGGAAAAAAGGAAVVAFLIHGTKVGGRLLVRLVSERPPARLILTLGEDALLAGLLAVALEDPGLGAVLAAVPLVFAAVVGLGPLRTYAFSLRLARALLRSLARPPRWLGAEGLPLWAASLPGPESPGTGARVASVGAWNPGALRGFHRGWLLVRGGSALLLLRPGGRPRVVELPAGAGVSVQRTTLYHRIVVGEGEERVLLFLGRDGPPLEALEGELSPALA